MRSLTERLEYVKVVLCALSQGPLSRTMLCKRFIQASGTPATFECVFRFLVQNGYIEKSGVEYRAPYRITDKGRKFLEGLS